MSLVGAEGIRALTHGRVDAAARLPAGSTSNHFRTRAALVAGVIQWLAAAEREDAGAAPITSRDELVSGLVRMIEVQSGPRAGRTRARYALFLEADDDSVEPLRAQRVGMEQWLRGILTTLGGPDAAARTPLLMAACDGVLLHRLTVDPKAPIRDVVEGAVHAVLAP